MGAVGWFLLHGIDVVLLVGKWSGLVALVVIIPISVLVYFILLSVFRYRERNELWEMFFKRKSKGRCALK